MKKYKFNEVDEKKVAEDLKNLLNYLNDKIKINYENVINSKWISSTKEMKKLNKNYDDLVNIMKSIQEEYKKITGFKLPF